LWWWVWLVNGKLWNTVSNMMPVDNTPLIRTQG
jgi:hypothetical protein